MRILVVAHGFPPLAQGGSEIYAFEHARTLVSLGHNVLVLTREQDRQRPERALRRDTRDGMEVLWVNNTFADTRNLEDSYEHPRLAAAVAPAIDAFRPDIAHIHHLTCLSTRLVFDLEARGVPVIYTLHDYWLLCHRGQRLTRHFQVCQAVSTASCTDCLENHDNAVTGTLKAAGLGKLATRVLPAAAASSLAMAARAVGGPAADAATTATRRAAHMQEVMARVTHFLAPSLAMLEAFVQAGVPRQRIEHWPYGFDHARFPERAASTRQGPPLRLGFVGSLMVSKAPHVLLEAQQQLPPGSTTVEIFGAPADYHGDTSYREQLAPLLTGPSVRVHGSLPHGDIPARVREMDALVVTSVWAENSPLVIHEALLAGVPVVASRTGGIVELVIDGVNGLLCEPGDVDGLAAALRRLLDEPDLLPRLRAHRTPIRTIADDARRAIELYQSCLRAAPPATLTSSRHAGSADADGPRVAAVVVHYRTPESTELAVRALLASAPAFHRVIVVNNDVTPCPLPPELLRRVVLIDTGANLGFSGGVNAGIRDGLAHGATHVMLVNSDAIVPPDCQTRLCRALAQTPGAGIAGPVLVSRTQPDSIASAGMRYDARSGRMRHLRFGESLTRGGNQAPVPVDTVSGCVMLISREVFEQAGLFVDEYFYSFEDFDFCLTAGAHGFLTVLAPDAVVPHHGGQSIGPQSSRRLYFAARNHLLLNARMSKNDPVGRWARHAVITGLNLAHAVTSPGGGVLSRVGAVVRGVRDYASGRFGVD